MYFSSAAEGWAVGDNGVMLRYSLGPTAVGVQEFRSTTRPKADSVVPVVLVAGLTALCAAALRCARRRTGAKS